MSAGPIHPVVSSLSPGRDDEVLVRSGQAAGTEIYGAKRARDGLGRDVVRRDQVQDLAPAECLECPIDRGDGCLCRVAVSPCAGHDPPADLGARPSFLAAQWPKEKPLSLELQRADRQLTYQVYVVSG